MQLQSAISERVHPCESARQHAASGLVPSEPFDDGAEETRQDFTANDFRITRALDSLLISAQSIKSDPVSAADITARVQTLRHLLKQVGHDV